MVRFIIVIALLSLLPMKAESQRLSNEELKEIDKYITNAVEIPTSYYDSLLLKYPEDTYLQSMKAMKLVFDGELESARKVLNQISSEKADDTYVLTANGVLATEEGNWALADKLYMKALSQDNRNKWLQLELFNHYNEVDPSLAWEHLEEAISIDPYFTVALLTKSYELDQVKNCKEIIELLEPVRKESNDYELLIYLGEAYYNCHDLNEAEKCLLRSCGLTPNARAYFTLGHLEYNDRKRYDKAIDFYEQGLKIDENDPYILNDLGWLYFDIKKYKKAEKSFKKLLTVDNSQIPYNQLITYYTLTRQHTRAKEKLKEATEVNGVSHFTEGFEIVLAGTFDGELTGLQRELLDSYRTKYNDQALNWLQETLTNIQERIVDD